MRKGQKMRKGTNNQIHPAGTDEDNPKDRKETDWEYLKRSRKEYLARQVQESPKHKANRELGEAINYAEVLDKKLEEINLWITKCTLGNMPYRLKNTIKAYEILRVNHAHATRIVHEKMKIMAKEMGELI